MGQVGVYLRRVDMPYIEVDAIAQKRRHTESSLIARVKALTGKEVDISRLPLDICHSEFRLCSVERDQLISIPYAMESGAWGGLMYREVSCPLCGGSGKLYPDKDPDTMGATISCWECHGCGKVYRKRDAT